MKIDDRVRLEREIRLCLAHIMEFAKDTEWKEITEDIPNAVIFKHKHLDELKLDADFSLRCEKSVGLVGEHIFNYLYYKGDKVAYYQSFIGHLGILSSDLAWAGKFKRMYAKREV